MQGLHSAPLSRFVTTVNTAKLTLEEAARLLTLLWRVSLPTNGQCTLHCEQVGGGTWIQRLGDATRAYASVSCMSSPGPDSADVPLGWGLCQRAGKLPCLLSGVPAAPCVSYLVSRHPCSPDQACPHSWHSSVEGNPVRILHMKQPRARE